MANSIQPQSLSFDMASYQRWYDDDLYLSSLMNAIARMLPQTQQLFGELLNVMADELISSAGHDELLASLPDRVMDGLRKSQRKERWYDHQTELHQAFNKLYALNDEQRSDLAHRLFIPSQLVEKYEIYCQEANIPSELRVVEQMIATCLQRGPEHALNLYGVYIDYFRTPE